MHKCPQLQLMLRGVGTLSLSTVGSFLTLHECQILDQIACSYDSCLLNYAEEQAEDKCNWTVAC